MSEILAYPREGGGEIGSNFAENGHNCVLNKNIYTICIILILSFIINVLFHWNNKYGVKLTHKENFSKVVTKKL